MSPEFAEAVELTELPEAVEFSWADEFAGFAWTELFVGEIGLFWANGLLLEGLVAPKLAGVWPDWLNWFDARKGLLFELSIIIFY